MLRVLVFDRRRHNAIDLINVILDITVSGMLMQSPMDICLHSDSVPRLYVSSCCFLVCVYLTRCISLLSRNESWKSSSGISTTTTTVNLHNHHGTSDRYSCRAPLLSSCFYDPFSKHAAEAVAVDWRFERRRRCFLGASSFDSPQQAPAAVAHVPSSSDTKTGSPKKRSTGARRTRAEEEGEILEANYDEAQEEDVVDDDNFFDANSGEEEHQRCNAW
jgi:hypothetical protein